MRERGREDLQQPNAVGGLLYTSTEPESKNPSKYGGI